MSDPVLTQEPFVWFTCDRDPTASEPVVDSEGFYNDPNWLFMWWNQTSDDVFMCVDNTPSAMVWKRISMS